MKLFTSKNQKIGELGEDIACKYIEKQGFIIKERNYTKKWGEIDIIAQKDNKLYFFEVKSVSCVTLPDLKDNKGHRKRPEENMHPQKMRRIARTISTYLLHKKVGEADWQFDLLLVFLDTENRLARVHKMENIIL